MSDLTKEINDLKNDADNCKAPPTSNHFDEGSYAVLVLVERTLTLLERLSKRLDELERFHE